MVDGATRRNPDGKAQHAVHPNAPPQVDTPQVDAPQVNAPQVDAQQVSTPPVDAQHEQAVHATEQPDAFATPSHAGVPSVADLSAVPHLPSVDLSTIATPSVQTLQLRRMPV